MASALISASGNWKYSRRGLSFSRRSRISTAVSPYWWANAMASSVVFPISSVMALMRDLSQWLRAHKVLVAHAAPAARSSRLVIDSIVIETYGMDQRLRQENPADGRRYHQSSGG